MPGSDPVGLPGLAVLMAGFLAFVLAFVLARHGADAGERQATRSRRSMLGIGLQALAIFAVAFGAQRVTLDPLGPAALFEAAVVAVLMGGAVALFVAATRAMGRNWSVVARTRGDHQLVESGPFARVRHPIYLALGLILLAVAIALGHTGRLVFALPLYALGTWLRVAEEERLLRGTFGDTYDAYATRVKRFVPGLF